MSRLQFIALGVLCLALSLPAQVRFGAALNGNNEVPPVPTTATGIADVTLNQHNNTLTYRVSTSGLNGTAAHFHTGIAGANGPVLIGLVGGPSMWEGTTVPLSSSELATLFNAGLYVNVHSAGFPSGQIRGQLVPIVRRPFVATLSGANEVPPVVTAATGSAIVYLNDPINTLDYDLTTSGVSATAAHIHAAPAGMNGPVLRALNSGSAHTCGSTTPLTPAEATTLMTGGCYVNVHSAVNPGGEIRGQLMPQNTMTFVAFLNGAQEVPPVATPATGLATFVLDLAANTLSYEVTVTGLTGTLSASHIHTAPQGSSAGVRFGFPGAMSPGFSGVWSSASTPAFSAADITNLLTRRFYVNVHTSTFGGGEIRGQIEQNPKVYGLSHADAVGKRHIDFKGSPVLGNIATITLSGADPNLPAFLFIEGLNAQFAGLALPATLAGLNGYVWVDVTALNYVPLVTDSGGCAEFSVPLPIVPALRGATFHLQWLCVGPITPSTSEAMKLTLQ